MNEKWTNETIINQIINETHRTSEMDKIIQIFCLKLCRIADMVERSTVT